MTEEIGIKLVGENWYKRLRETLHSPQFAALGKFLTQERLKYTVYPSKADVFRAFLEVPFDRVKVVILGQDPYHDGSATGLAFANSNNRVVPQPSLKFILQEVENSCYDGFDINTPVNFGLENWAHQGVFLLNAALTVRKGEAGSHSLEWEFFTQAVIKALSEGHSGLIWMLWGLKAKKFKGHIQSLSHHVLEAAHPAAEAYGSGGFLGCGHFKKANELLEAMNGPDAKIKW